MAERARTAPTVFRKFDAGDGFRTRQSKGRDCQVRALVTASGRDYHDAWSLLYLMQGERRRCDFGLVDALRDNDERLGVVREIPFPAIRGKRRMNATAFCKLFPKGRFILRMAHHVAAVKDGQIYDTHDCTTACVYSAWEVRKVPSV